MKNFIVLHVIDLLICSDGTEIETDKKCVFIRPDMIVAFWPKKSNDIRSYVAIMFPNDKVQHWTVSDSIYEIEEKINKWSEENGRNQSGDARTKS